MRRQVKGYKYYCPYCDEDLYSFETTKKKKLKGKRGKK